MINLGRCLVYLLSHHEKVSLAGWGTFLHRGQSAYFDPEEQAFYPRSYEIEFRSESTAPPAHEKVGFTQQLLIDYISTQRKVDAEEAARLYREAFDLHQQELESKGQTSLSGLGLLKVGSQGIYLEPTALPEDMSRVVARELPLLHPIPTPTKTELVQEVEINQENKFDQELELNQETENESKDEGRGIARYGWIAAASILLLGAALVILKPAEVYRFLSARGVEMPILARLAGDTPVFKEENLNRHEVESEAPRDRVDSSLITDSVFMESAALETDSVETLALVGEEVDPVADKNQPRVSYEIIVGSFRSMEQANSFVEEMAQKNIKVWAIDSRMPENRKKVSCASYPTEKEAYQALKEIQRTIEPGAWVARVER